MREFMSEKELVEAGQKIDDNRLKWFTSNAKPTKSFSPSVLSQFKIFLVAVTKTILRYLARRNSKLAKEAL
jgi:hypothetical protein